MKRNPDEKIVKEITKALKENDGYCPCEFVKTSDTKCPCKKMKTINECTCGLFVSE